MKIQILSITHIISIIWIPHKLNYYSFKTQRIAVLIQNETSKQFHKLLDKIKYCKSLKKKKSENIT